jgi:hypothetical protein
MAASKTSEDYKGKNVAILQYDDRNPVEEGLAKLMQLNEKYARKHGYEYLYYDTPYQTADGMAVNPYWSKVFLIRDLIEAGYKAVFWLDSDAAVDKQTLSVAEFIRKQKKKSKKPNGFVFMGHDLPEYSSFFNAGAILVLSTPRTLPFLNAWIGKFHPEKWSKDEKKGKWECYNGKKKCHFAGIEYEQGAFEQLAPSYEDSIIHVPWYVFTNFDYKSAKGKRNFVMHFPGEYRNRMYSYLDFVLNGTRPPKKQMIKEVTDEIEILEVTLTDPEKWQIKIIKNRLKEIRALLTKLKKLKG